MALMSSSVLPLKTLTLTLASSSPSPRAAFFPLRPPLPPIAVRCRAAFRTAAVDSDYSLRWSSISEPRETILIPVCDYNHWLIVMEFPKDPAPTREQMIATYLNTLATVVGSMEEAKKNMYAFSTTTYTGFQCTVTEETSKKFKGLPGVLSVLPDPYIDVKNKDYGEKALRFPRMNVWEPYKRLGLTRDASEEEIRGARNFLLEHYAGQEASVESVEAAYERILMTSFRERKKSKINLKSKLKKKVEESPPWVQTLLSYVEVPPMDIVLRRLFLFAFLGVWSVTHSTESGPAFQVLLSLGSCIYFLNDKMKNVLKASLTGFASLVVGWAVGSVLVPAIPVYLLQPTWTLELLTSLVCYVFLFLSCTFLK